MEAICFFLFGQKLQHRNSKPEDLTSPCTLRKYEFISNVPYFSSCFHGNMTGDEGHAIGSEVSNCTNENAPGSKMIASKILHQKQPSSKDCLLCVHMLSFVMRDEVLSSINAEWDFF